MTSCGLEVRLSDEGDHRCINYGNCYLKQEKKEKKGSENTGRRRRSIGWAGCREQSPGWLRVSRAPPPGLHPVLLEPAGTFLYTALRFRGLSFSLLARHALRLECRSPRRLPLTLLLQTPSAHP